MNAHSPAPWSIRKGVAIDDARGRWIGSAVKSAWINPDEAQANARVMAIAPEAVAALRLYFSDPVRFNKAASDVLAKLELA